MAVKNDLQNLTSMIKTMESQIQMLKDMDESTITVAYGLDISIRDVISKMSMEEIAEAIESSRNLKSAYNSLGITANEVINARPLKA